MTRISRLKKLERAWQQRKLQSSGKLAKIIQEQSHVDAELSDIASFFDRSETHIQFHDFAVRHSAALDKITQQNQQTIRLLQRKQMEIERNEKIVTKLIAKLADETALEQVQQEMATILENLVNANAALLVSLRQADCENFQTRSDEDIAWPSQ